MSWSDVWLIRCARFAPLALVLGCGIDKPLETPSVDCAPPLSFTCRTPAPSFANDIVPILDARCNGCHDPTNPDGPWPLHDYQDVLDWKGLVLETLLNCTMPPPDASSMLPEQERQRLFAWLACDAPDN